MRWSDVTQKTATVNGPSEEDEHPVGSGQLAPIGMNIALGAGDGNQVTFCNGAVKLAKLAH
jgi:hypothetical protein